MVRLKAGVAVDKPRRTAAFQFHYGTIKSGGMGIIFNPTSCFNSTMVRLKEFLSLPNPHSFARFNSTMVRLKDQWPDGFPELRQRFNSTMVRLKVYCHTLINLETFMFQFHYGTIKRDCLRHSRKTRTQFQFHYGTIKSFVSSFIFSFLISSFNSTMVRLKAVAVARSKTPYPFQFHYGTIKSHYSDARLLHNEIVSIPLWYD